MGASRILSAKKTLRQGKVNAQICYTPSKRLPWSAPFSFRDAVY
ncbi:MAG: hypothetical protein RHS_4244 [Robinsoniella sp. RHS]|nr:MAG: hypothetical protein RHS_4244 [Robinsoniella sp. RHS]